MIHCTVFLSRTMRVSVDNLTFHGSKTIERDCFDLANLGPRSLLNFVGMLRDYRLLDAAFVRVLCRRHVS